MELNHLPALFFIMTLILPSLGIESFNVPKENAQTLKQRQYCPEFPISVEGENYLEGQANRSDIIEGKQGVALTLEIQILDQTWCSPIPNVVVELWQADALGEYSGIGTNSTDQTSLRGYQRSGVGSGTVVFRTIVPGWHAGRAAHININTSVNNRRNPSQLFFTEDLIQQISRLSPYTDNHNPRIANSEDEIYQEYDGGASTLNLLPYGNGYYAFVPMAYL